MYKNPEQLGAQLRLAHEVFGGTIKYLQLPDSGKMEFLYHAADIIDQIEQLVTSPLVSWRDVLAHIEGFPEEEIFGEEQISGFRAWVDSNFPDAPGTTNQFKQTFKSAYRLIARKYNSRTKMYKRRQDLPGTVIKNSSANGIRYRVEKSGFIPRLDMPKGQLF